MLIEIILMHKYQKYAVYNYFIEIMLLNISWLRNYLAYNFSVLIFRHIILRNAL